MKVFTIGFTQKSAEAFFGRLQQAGVKRLLDIRLNPGSQLAGFAKQRDLPFFLRALAGIDYRHLPELAPTRAILDAYKKHGGAWAEYERRFLALLRERQVESRFAPALFESACLLCSEPTPQHCHRRLVAEYLQRHWSGLEIVHL
ncbi:hypothetical protein MIN45_P1319 [Methylomarinovum tepidoasis]|uniref:DUF488 domain-containing protein n=1 Tax=Methylomarinovum tepidoasis TaxID=2840183 RepID=A0AAU9CY38_9GAMM|nr:DUF488 domain-containing protein [Methylomarinovum sp. IN45]BCX88949.1 hypothetical protein MIN45_P1319 [Methylomarinovum sp. IN45]